MKAVAGVVIGLALLVPASAQASFPGANGKIAFVRAGDIWTMDPDGTNQVNLTNDAPVQNNPAWSADGNRIAFDQNVATAALATGWARCSPTGANRTLIETGGHDHPGPREIRRGRRTEPGSPTTTSPRPYST